MSIDNPDTQFRVVINQEEQYAIWPTFKEVPNGWTQVGQEGTKDSCLTYISEHWQDMRPKSLRDALEQGTDHQTSAQV